MLVSHIYPNTATDQERQVHPLMTQCTPPQHKNCSRRWSDLPIAPYPHLIQHPWNVLEQDWSTEAPGWIQLGSDRVKHCHRTSGLILLVSGTRSTVVDFWVLGVASLAVLTPKREWLTGLEIKRRREERKERKNSVTSLLSLSRPLLTFSLPLLIFPLCLSSLVPTDSRWPPRGCWRASSRSYRGWCSAQGGGRWLSSLLPISRGRLLSLSSLSLGQEGQAAWRKPIF